MKLKNLDKDESFIRSPNYDGLPKPKGFVESNLERRVLKKLDEKAKLELQIDETQEKIDTINMLLKCLNEKDKKLIEFKYFKEMKGEELSEKLDMTENGIYKAQKRIINYMEKIYKKWTSI